MSLVEIYIMGSIICIYAGVKILLINCICNSGPLDFDSLGICLGIAWPMVGEVIIALEFFDFLVKKYNN